MTWLLLKLFSLKSLYGWLIPCRHFLDCIKLYTVNYKEVFTWYQPFIYGPLLPHVHAQGVRKSVCANLSVVVVTPKIAHLRDLGTFKTHELVK